MLYEFKAVVQDTDKANTLLARIAPFNEPVPFGKSTVQFQRGLIEYGDHVPLTIDHAPGVMNRVGTMTAHYESDDGAYAEFLIADTDIGRNLLALMENGAVTDVSVGILHEGPTTGDLITMRGRIDHVSVVDHGRFSAGGLSNPAAVLSVHDESEPDKMTDTIETVDEQPVQVVQFDDAQLRESIATLAERMDAMTPSAPDNKTEFSGVEVLTALLMRQAGRAVTNHALEDVIGDLGSADASGIVPDSYWSGGLQHNVDKRRPLFNTAGSAPFPTSGNNLELPHVTQDTTVEAHSGEKAAVSSQALQAVMRTFPLTWYSGAVDISMEIISQSDPSVLTVVTESLLAAYARATEAGATAAAAANAVHTGAALDTATYAGLIGDLLTTSDLIEDVTGAPGDIVGVTPAQWIAIMTLVDSNDRRQFATIAPQNADGSGSLVTRGIDVGGIFVYRAPYATTALQYNRDTFKAAEKTPMSVAATNVELMGRDYGVLGATVHPLWVEGIYSYEVTP